MRIVIPEEFDGRLLRSYLQHTLGISIKMLKRLKTVENGITVNGSHATVRYQLRTGDVLEISDMDDNCSEKLIPKDLPISILYEDEHIAVINKPPHMPTHPSHGHITDTLANALAFYYKKQNRPFVFRPIGRLDRNTSGVVMVGKTQAAAGSLGNAIMNGEMRKRYIAIVEGAMEQDNAFHKIDIPIRRTSDSIIMRTACGDGESGAEAALTNYRTIFSKNGYSVVLCEPCTGRTHQIRVHLSHIGHPIVGDDLYGSDGGDLISRHALHALSITFPVPFFRAANGTENTWKTSTLGEDIEDADGMLSLLSGVVNRPTDRGIFVSYAPLPSDMRELAEKLFGSIENIPFFNI